VSKSFASARRLGLVSCHDCHLLSRWPNMSSHQTVNCPRCGGELHQRKPNSIAKTWALVITAVIFYIPANLLPMTITSALGNVQADTIISGVIYFIHSGSWEIALVIFTASVFVPFMKFLILIYLLLSVQFKSIRRPRDRTVLYRITEAVGRWSMVDVYVVTILVALVKLGVLADIEAGPAAIYFASVVVTTMFAAESFDPRLIWDAMEEEE
jgi:paraquat-inducible protein A